MDLRNRCLEDEFNDMPKLSEWLDEMLRQDGPDTKGRVRILDGATRRLRYTHKAMYRKNAHAAIRYKHGGVTFQSKHVTDELLAAGVAAARRTGNGWIVSVYIPMGRYHKRPEKPGTFQEPLPPPPNDRFNYDPDEELPFN